VSCAGQIVQGKEDYQEFRMQVLAKLGVVGTFVHDE
jgi:hypothetical protein